MRQTKHPSVSAWETKASKPLAVKIWGGRGSRRKSQSHTGESVGGANKILECAQAYSPGNRHLKEHNLLVEIEGNRLKAGKSEARGIVPSLTPPPHTAPQCSQMCCPALANT